MKTPLSLIALVSLFTFSPGLASGQTLVDAGEHSSDITAAVDLPSREQARGRAQVAIGLAFQGVNLGLITAQITGELAGHELWQLTPVSMGVQIGSSVAAPFAIDGFRLLHEDDARGVSLGLLEGGLYSLSTAGLLGVLSATHYEVNCARQRAAWDGQGYGPCFEDLSGLVWFVQALPHLIVGGSMLISGGVVAAVADKRGADWTARLPPVLPSVSPTDGGVRIGLTGRF